MANAIYLPFVMHAAEANHRMQLPYSANAVATSLQTAGFKETVGREGARSHGNV